MSPPPYRPRGITSRLTAALGAAPVVVVEGGRGWGKTRLATNLGDATPLIRTHVDLSRPSIAEQAATDPDGFVRGLRRPALIDEAQLDPGLLLAVKRLADDSAEPGQILLTGSARLGRDALGGSDPLAGRATWLSLSPMTVGERQGHALRSFIPAVFDGDLVAEATGRLSRRQLTQLMVRGGIPRVPGVLSPAAPSATREFLDGYPPSVIPYLPGATGVDRTRLLQTYRYLAGVPHQILNASRAASDLAIGRDTFARYRDLLEASFLLRAIPAHRGTPNRSATAHPRLSPTDTALACRAVGLTLVREPDANAFGRVLETLVVNELHAQATWGSEGVEIRHWRDTARRKEVDLLLVHPDGRLVGVEVKAASDAGSRDTAGLRALADAFPHAYHRGLVLHTGDRRHQVGDREWAVPLTDLWDTPPTTTRSTVVMTPSSPPLADDAAGAVFVSYTHDDDAADGGRIVALARGLATRLRLRGSSLQVFVDKDLRWGEVWRQRIDQQLARTTIFVPFVTPLFLQSPECRRELDGFLSTADATGQMANLLPIMWRGVPGSWDDDLTARIPDHQWQDWSPLVYEDATSGPVLRALDDAAERLIEIAGTPAPAASAPAEGSDDPADDTDLLGLIEGFEPAAEAFMTSVGDFRSAFEDWGASFTENGATLSTITSGSSPSQVRAALTTLAGRMARPTTEMEGATETLRSRRDAVDAVVSALLRQPSSGAVPDDLVEPIREGLAGFPADAGIDPDEVTEMRQMVGVLGTFSRDLQPIATALDRAITTLVDTAAMIERWQRQVDHV